MPKTKELEKKISSPGDDLEKIIEIDTEDKVVDPELIPGEEAEDELDEDAVLDDEEVDPFKDKWEE
ncbi:MAG: hypothetical protein Q8Q03_03025 [bacterium]|nr:hypothetical protein [bacterium]